MKSKDLIERTKAEFGTAFMAAISLGDEKAVAEAVSTFAEKLQDIYMADAKEIGDDKKVLASRGVRQLTSAETKYYNAVIEAMHSNTPKAAITNIKEAMPETIIDAVIEDIKADFPLLDAIDFQNTTGLTKYLYNTQGPQKAKWGALGTKITQELEGSIGIINVEMYKLTAFMAISKDFLKLGPAWLDKYSRAILSEANGLAMEEAIVDGDGSEGPIGMTRDLTAGTTSNGVTTYTRKTAIECTSFTPEKYGAILAPLTEVTYTKDSVTTKRYRKLDEVIMVVNPANYLLKVMPATTILTPQGTYVSDVLPFPTKVIQSVAVPADHAVIGIPENYFMGMGTSKEGYIEFDDSVQFLDDNRVYTSHLYGNGRPKDNFSFEYLDISKLESTLYTVKAVEETA